MSNNQQQKEAFKWSEENQVLMDPFAPRKVPNYEYSMPESSPSDKETEMEVSYQPSGPQAPTNQYVNNGNHYDARYYAPTHYGGNGGGDSSAVLHYNGGGGGGGGGGMISHVAGPSSEKRSPSKEAVNAGKHEAKRIKLERSSGGDGGAAGGKGDGGAAKGEGGHGGKAERQEVRGGGEMGGMRRYRRETNAPRGHRDSCGPPPTADPAMKPGSLPIHRSVIDDLKRRIADIKRAVRNGHAGTSSTAANYAQMREHDWNMKVLAFLETNLAHAEHTNHYLSVKC